MSAVLGLIIGTIIFFIINESMNITYFGCGAILGLWGACVMFTAVIFTWLGGFVLGMLKWVLIGAAIIAVLGFIGNKMNNKVEE